MVTVVSVVGARPQFVKLAPVHKSLITNGFEHRIIHTGQHYDAKLSDVFFQEFGIPEPDINLGIGSHSHATQTARIMIGLEENLIDLNP
ncbi:MAG TPA: UDP-N-acetylglucosamine 2-epimerase (non-hydrolyzing), partial [Gammaproteobacteria bacterium]|nr:UDP-N-acetylglucosamine 2-epimerase (non-hydrolyzing) [Gammaproteobacteria bacterium]